MTAIPDTGASAADPALPKRKSRVWAKFKKSRRFCPFRGLWKPIGALCAKRRVRRICLVRMKLGAMCFQG